MELHVEYDKINCKSSLKIGNKIIATETPDSSKAK